MITVFCVISAPTLISPPFLDLLVLTCFLKYGKEREFFVTFFTFHQNILEKPAKFKQKSVIQGVSSHLQHNQNISAASAAMVLLKT